MPGSEVVGGAQTEPASTPVPRRSTARSDASSGNSLTTNEGLTPFLLRSVRHALGYRISTEPRRLGRVPQESSLSLGLFWRSVCVGLYPLEVSC